MINFGKAKFFSKSQKILSFVAVHRIHSYNSYQSQSTNQTNNSQFSTSQEVNIKSMKFGMEKKPLIDPKISNQHYDIAVIGGGSAGLAFVFEAQKLGLKPIVFDYVDPSPQNSKWGLGGCCVNVGCIPKKLMHQASIHGENIVNSYDFGWDLDQINDYQSKPEEEIKKKFNWNTLVDNIQSYIKSINYSYKTDLAGLQIPYVNAIATIKDQNTILYSPEKQQIQNYLDKKEIQDSTKFGQITADYIVICTGGRPNIYLNSCKNIEKYAITSDDIFMQKKIPNKTLVVGGGYIALECAGFLSGLGYDTTIMTRSIFLRSFDRQVTDMITEDMEKMNKAKLMKNTLPYNVQKLDNGRYKVQWTNQQDQNIQGEDGINFEIILLEFDTILMAIGRKASTKLLNLDSIGIKHDQNSQKIIGGFNNEIEQSSVQNIYALGDVLEGASELQPIAMKSGQLLARRIKLYKENIEKSSKLFKKTMLDYNKVPTSVFTPLEYSTCGLSEEQSYQKYGQENIEIYHSQYSILEESLSQKFDENFQALKRKAYCKIICNKLDNEKVIGLHYLGPNSGEIMQGMSIALNLGLSKEDLEDAIGIHPTVAEEFVYAKVTKSSGEDFVKKSC